MGALALTSVKAQQLDNNLVINGDFEFVEDEPNAYGEANEAIAWTDANAGTPDLYTEENRSHLNVPENDLGQQVAFSGEHYAGIIAHYEDGALDLASLIKGGDGEKIGYGKYREYVQAELERPLVAGQAYTVAFRVNLAEESDRAIAGLGAHFSEEHMNLDDNTFLPVKPQVSSKKVVKDKNEWVEITGTFIAEGGERHVTIGAFEDNFKVDDLSSKFDNDSRKAYYYIDAVEVTPFTPAPVVTPVVTVVDYDVLLSGSKITLDRVFFDIGEDEMSEKAKADLKQLAKWLKDHPDAPLAIAGHTDEQGTDEFNHDLSHDRAEVVKEFLIKQGVDADRLRTYGFGDDMPWDKAELYDNPLNRRTEVQLIVK